MRLLGYEETARICLTHSFCEGTLDCYIGKFDITEAETEELRQALAQTVFDDYDRLIQLCDSLAAAEGVVDSQYNKVDCRHYYIHGAETA